MSVKARIDSSQRNEPAVAPELLETLAVTVERVTFRNADTGFAVRMYARQTAGRIVGQKRALALAVRANGKRRGPNCGNGGEQIDRNDICSAGKKLSR